MKKSWVWATETLSRIHLYHNPQNLISANRIFRNRMALGGEDISKAILTACMPQVCQALRSSVQLPHCPPASWSSPTHIRIDFTFSWNRLITYQVVKLKFVNITEQESRKKLLHFTLDQCCSCKRVQNLHTVMSRILSSTHLRLA